MTSVFLDGISHFLILLNCVFLTVAFLGEFQLELIAWTVETVLQFYGILEIE
jgi:hypothetical protein